MTTAAGTGVVRFALDGSEITLGRDPSCTVPLEGIGISRHHAIIHLDPDHPSIEDNNSTFGLRVNDMPVHNAALSSGITVSIGIKKFTIEIDGGAMLLVPAGEEEPGKREDAPDLRETWIGRGSDSDLRLDHPLVSRFHAVVRKSPGGSLAITDNQSTNGTFVNGHPVARADLHDGDIIQIGPYRLFLEKGRLLKDSDFNRIRLEAFSVSIRRKNRAIIGNVSLSIAPGEFVAILGSSGAGKTTLARVLTGHLLPSSGEVCANGLPLRKFLGAFAGSIGYVAQETVLYPELTVEETFREQSKLRLPRDSSEAERNVRIKEVTELLELDSVKKRRISDLSGGEAKRVHLGIELLASPSLIFLDEPMSGLDPGLVRKFMQLFRRICDRGYTLLLTTHTLEQIELCDRAIFMHHGKVLFQGPSSTLPHAFSVNTLPEVYERVLKSSPDDFNGVPASAGAKEEPGAGKPVPYQVRTHKRRSIAFTRQMTMLLGRYFKVFVRDRKNALLIIIQSPLLALLLAFVFRPEATYLPMSFYFCVTIAAIWVGGVASIREIAREWTLLERDFRAGLSIFPYGLAKLAVFCGIGLFQAGLFWITLVLLFRAMTFNFQEMLLVTAATLSGIILALCISSLCGNTGRAVSMLPIIFIPQIFFSGILIPFDSMTGLGRLLSYLTVSRPVFGMFKQVSLLKSSIGELSEWRALFALAAGLIILTLIATVARVRSLHKATNH